jgi:hypothetical protein
MKVELLEGLKIPCFWSSSIMISQLVGFLTLKFWRDTWLKDPMVGITKKSKNEEISTLFGQSIFMKQFWHENTFILYGLM